MKGTEMKFGVGCKAAMVPVAEKLGFDYVEIAVYESLQPLNSEAEFEDFVAQQQHDIAWTHCHCFLPSSVPVTGPDVDAAQVEAYVRTACRRAEKAGVGVIVFGSGGARNLPEGWSADEGTQQLDDFLAMAGPIAEAHAVTLVVEHLNQSQGAGNIFTTVSECAAAVRRADSPAIKLLVDSWHWGLDGLSVEEITDAGELIAHTHVATIPERHAPHPEDTTVLPFVEALRSTGYDRTMSLEVGSKDPEKDWGQALELLRTWFS